MADQVPSNLSAIIQPWTIVKNHEHNEPNLTAPAWVNSPDIRGTFDILQSCILTLVACIYTALHLDVPIKTAWHEVFLYKLKWTAITLFAPEISLYMAADQLQQAWSLKAKLLALQTRSPSDKDHIVIDMSYTFFIVMGGVRVNIDDLLSFPDLHDKAFRHFNPANRPYSVRLSPLTVIWLAERGHWIPISKKKIDDKSKADYFQKLLVMTQVLWMIMQCIMRKIHHLPLSLLEVHTMVHVVCAVFLYMCWFRKPLDVQQPEIIRPEAFKGEIALLIQRQYYPNMSTRLALFPPQQDSDRLPPPRRGGLIQPGWVIPKSSRSSYNQEIEELQPLQGTSTSSQAWSDLTQVKDSAAAVTHEERSNIWTNSRPGPWVKPEPGLEMWPGDILPSGLLYHSEFTTLPLILTKEFLCRWDAILSTFPFHDRNSLATTAKFIKVNETTWQFELVDPKYDSGPQNGQDLFLARLPEFEPVLECAYRTMPFGEGKRNLDINFSFFTENENVFGLSGFFKEFPWLAGLFLVLSGIYGGVHLSAWNWEFPSELERLIWIPKL
ncbi:uncharacterized protein FIESC28_06246 [Fusarium coffeatum]|uniref:Uncharacterized protein n=1 Tax=Fusarium coffeatum TaxID=231269 RepID=A0A366RKZ8_9HYPO|nr:uncharacterized protein FIESC28_06246 [Fusarium coffeatum]RBR17807.1 hypothetical protein FIESC28_06246 [Fusarium coffeatum]